MLTFAEFFESDSFEVGHMEEHVSPAARVDETKSLVRNLLNLAFSHSSHLTQNLKTVFALPEQHRASQRAGRNVASEVSRYDLEFCQT